MITEPDYGSDALNMKTSYAEHDDHYHLEGHEALGRPHRLGRLLARHRPPARRRAATSRRDIDFFICRRERRRAGHHVEEFYENLGLYMIRYGRNRIDARVPEGAPPRAALDGHQDDARPPPPQPARSSPAWGWASSAGCSTRPSRTARERLVGNQPLFDYDQVRARLARMQAEFTTVSAMCLYASENAGIEQRPLEGVGPGATPSRPSART